MRPTAEWVRTKGTLTHGLVSRLAVSVTWSPRILTPFTRVR